MSVAPVRCTAPHPRQPHRKCNEWLGNGNAVQVTRGANPPPSCIEVKCPRCGTRYVVCPRAA